MENQQAGWRNHLLLIVGVALPVLLMVFVTVYQKWALMSVPMPRYAAVYSVFEGSDWNTGVFNTDVVDGRITVTFVPAKNNSNEKIDPTRAKLRVFVWRDTEKQPEVFEFSGTKEMTTETKMPIPEGLNFIINDREDAPDGYYFRPYNYSDRGLLNGLLVGGSGRDRGPHLANGGRLIQIESGRRDRESYSYNLRFIGWSVDEVTK